MNLQLVDSPYVYIMIIFDVPLLKLGDMTDDISCILLQFFWGHWQKDI